MRARIGRLTVVLATLLAFTGIVAPLARADLQARIAAADSYLATRPGVVGYVLRDRTTGARYANANADTMIWTASTIKLAMVVIC